MFAAAGVAQLVEHLICNQRVGGSNPFASSSLGGPEGTKAGEGRNSLACGSGVFLRSLKQKLMAASTEAAAAYPAVMPACPAQAQGIEQRRRGAKPPPGNRVPGI